MNMSKSTERLNKFKMEMNDDISTIERILNNLKKVDSAYANLENIAEIYRDKIYQIYISLEEQGIDFWSDEFPLRYAIMTHLKLKLYESSVMSEYVGLKIFESKSSITDRISKRKAKKLEPLTDRLNKMNNYIKSYDINKNLLETLIDYFRIVPKSLKGSNEITVQYNKMKENITSVCPMDLSKIEDDYITKIINEKEKKSKIKGKIRQRTR